jgi:hypothetical protein
LFGVARDEWFFFAFHGVVEHERLAVWRGREGIGVGVGGRRDRAGGGEPALNAA